MAITAGWKRRGKSKKDRSNANHERGEREADTIIGIKYRYTASADSVLEFTQPCLDRLARKGHPNLLQKLT